MPSSGAEASLPPFPWMSMLGVLGLVLLGTMLLTVQSALAGLGEATEESEAKAGTAGPHHDSGRIFDRCCWAGGLLCSMGATLLLIRLAVMAMPTGQTLAAMVAGAMGVALQFAAQEVIGRTLGLTHPRGVMKTLGGVAYVLTLPLRPIVLLIVQVQLLRHREGAVSRYVRDRELRLLPHVRGVDRVVEEEAVEMIDSVREFTTLTARDIMRPRTDLEAVPTGLERDDLLERLRHTPYSRLLVYGKNLDEVIGVLLVKEVLLTMPEDPYRLTRVPLVVPTTTRLPELLQLFRKAQTYMAVVVDEYGGTAGIVTLHDLVEQVIGSPIPDQEDDDELWLKLAADGSATLSGRVEVWEVNEELGLDLDESAARTLGGYLTVMAGSLPRVGARFPAGRGEFVVREVENNRIEIVGFQPFATEQAPREPQESAT